MAAMLARGTYWFRKLLLLSGLTFVVACSDDGTSRPSSQAEEPSRLVIRAPDALSATLGTPLELVASVETLNARESDTSVHWTVDAGPGTATFTNSQVSSTHASFDTPGDYQIVITARNGDVEQQQIIAVSIQAVVVNTAPVVVLPGNESVELSGVLAIGADVSDDGLPSGSLSQQWRQVSGPGTVVFGEQSATQTSATFDAAGDYVIELVATDGAEQTVASMNIIVTAPDVPDSTVSISTDTQWEFVTTSNGSKPDARHEAGAVTHNGKLYLLGGRGSRQISRFDPAQNRWENLGKPGFEFNHFQPVVFNDKIYVIGALSCCYPSEDVWNTIKLYDLDTQTWSDGPEIPQSRRRGAAGMVVYQGKIYLVGGNTNGHDGGVVSWFDEFNPTTNQWKVMPDVPNGRDHFNAVVVGDRLVAAGGRKTDYPNTFGNLVSAVDVFNFASGKWESGAPIPTTRAGVVAVGVGNEVVVIGGEKPGGGSASRSVEAYNPLSNQWRTLKPLQIGRHSGGAAVLDGAIHVVSGNITVGGGAETQSHEKLALD